jgi:hypothetical protein
MLDPNSRYANLPTAVLEVTDAEGETRAVRYVLRRFIPQPGDEPALFEHTVVQGERLDNIVARYLGDPTQYWIVCDANNVMRPEELTDEAGRRIRVVLPQT